MTHAGSCISYQIWDSWQFFKAGTSTRCWIRPSSSSQFSIGSSGHHPRRWFFSVVENQIPKWKLYHHSIIIRSSLDHFITSYIYQLAQIHAIANHKNILQITTEFFESQRLPRPKAPVSTALRIASLLKKSVAQQDLWFVRHENS